MQQHLRILGVALLLAYGDNYISIDLHGLAAGYYIINVGEERVSVVVQ
jgi:hypothetical protein